jgi:predicted CoA-binding protein
MTPEIQSFFGERRLAVVGVSRTKGFGNAALRTLRAAGWEAFPVNARADKVEGERCWRSLGDVPGPVGGVVCVVPPAETEKVVEECARVGIRKIWMQQGSQSEAAIRAARAHGMTVVAGECVLMYARPRGVHRLHRFFHELLPFGRRSSAAASAR